MHETPEEVAALQTLLDESYARSGEHFRSITTPERRPTAKQLVKYLTGVKHIALATVTRDGEPRVGPVDGWFLHGHFYFGSSTESVRAKHIKRRPAVSFTHVAGDDIAVTMHGKAVEIPRGSEEFKQIERYSVEVYGQNIWDVHTDAVLWRMDPTGAYAFASDPASLPE
jgi:uncharacterized pyridoxamine 5'-phosphate oxidase family protein